ncbi:MAG: MoxR family ATPase [Oscillospiraceae bacterium]|nr:MoxR family ATPase [Oscillospiraceae bacterium]
MKLIPEIQSIVTEIEKVIYGKRDVIYLTLASLLAGGHVLIEDVPGVGKTTLANALGKATGLDMRRAQFTPDVMASDLTGFSMWNKDKGVFEYKDGLLRCNIFLADEINRTPPKTQSALLEAMEERKISADGNTIPLPEPFMVIATQNELGYIGTYPLPEAQLDRFLMRLSIGYPSYEEETSLVSARRGTDPMNRISAVTDAPTIRDYIKRANAVTVDESVAAYIVSIVRNTREHKAVKLGCSPRAGILLMRAAQAVAFMSGRNYVIPEDAVNIVIPVLTHRLELKPEARGMDVKRILLDCINRTPVPSRHIPAHA